MDTNLPRTSASGVRSEDVPAVHNCAVDEDAALLGACAQVHLQSGRMCTLRHRHDGSCEFAPADLADAVLADRKAAGGW